MIKLLVADECYYMPELAQIIDRFHNIGRIERLQRNNESLSECDTQVLISEFNYDFLQCDNLYLLVAPNLPEYASLRTNQNVFSVVIRSSLSNHDIFSSVIIDEYSQLDHIANVEAYPGLDRLTTYRNKKPSDYRQDILTRYSNALNAIGDQAKVAIFGAQRLGLLVSDGLQKSGVNVVSFIDNDASKHGEFINEIPVQPLTLVKDTTIPVIIATTRFTTSISRQLESKGFTNIIPYAVMSLLDPELYPEEIPDVGIQSDFASNLHKYISLFLVLSDDKSRRVLDGIIQSRLDYNTHFAEQVADEYARQYFDEHLISFNSNDIYIDLGGYDGDTTEKYIGYCNASYRKIYIFEPDKNLFMLAKKRLISFPDIECIQAGAYSFDGELRFSASGRTNGAICSVGEILVPVCKLDNIITENPTIIKMDIEGAESDALIGAERLIRDARPKLSIAAYHYAPDLWRLIDVVREINPSYKFYLRHYSETGLESVIYAV